METPNRGIDLAHHPSAPDLQDRLVPTIDRDSGPMLNDCGSGRGGTVGYVASHEHGTGLSFLPRPWATWICRSWDHPARLACGSSMSSLTARVMSVDAEVVQGGVQGSQRG